MSKLSKLLVFLAFLVLAADVYQAQSAVHIELSLSKSLKEAAKSLSVPPKSLAREVGLPLDTTPEKSLAELGLNAEELNKASEHILSHRPKPAKYVLYLLFTLLGLSMLRSGQKPSVCLLVLAVLMVGFATGKSPNPMESVVKVFKTMVGLYPSISTKLLAFSFFAFLALIGNKLVCGWACPFGTFQELSYTIPINKKFRSLKIGHRLSLFSRGMLFVSALLLLFGVIGGKKGFVLYHSINPFNLFNLDVDYLSMWLVIAVSLLGGIVIYRPFCLLICPFGLFSNFLEQLSLSRVVINRSLCDECGFCANVCPTEAAKDLFEDKGFRADCFSCGRCLEKCPRKAIQYSRPGCSMEE